MMGANYSRKMPATVLICNTDIAILVLGTYVLLAAYPSDDCHVLLIIVPTFIISTIHICVYNLQFMTMHAWGNYIDLVSSPVFPQLEREDWGQGYLVIPPKLLTYNWL